MVVYWFLSKKELLSIELLAIYLMFVLLILKVKQIFELSVFMLPLVDLGHERTFLPSYLRNVLFMEITTFIP